MKLGIRLLRETEHELVELKARIGDLRIIRKKLTKLGAQHIGTYQQTDLYFEVPKGRLKLREAKGDDEAELIYYERENVAGPKRSDVYILKIKKPCFFTDLLKKALKTRIVVDKVREIYRLEGTQIHLDSVRKLGAFVEFERETLASGDTTRKDLRVLEELREKLGISPENLESLSYSDIILQHRYSTPQAS